MEGINAAEMQTIYGKGKVDYSARFSPGLAAPTPLIIATESRSSVGSCGQSPDEASSVSSPDQSMSPNQSIDQSDVDSDNGNSRFHFNSHMNSHFEHSCPHCDYTSRTEGRLKRHIKDFHSDNPPDNFSGNKTMRTQPSRPKTFKCKQCDFSTQDKIESWTHARIHIKEDKILQCPKCPFVTEYKHHLEYHLRNHFGSKPFKCPKCNYACVNKSMLNSHMKSHTNVYQYRCADCTYATKYCHSLKLHLKKYSHKPATVLNLDGSLPMDGSGDFELVSKRGPPRGPRGPRKDQMPGTPPVTLPHMGGLGSPPRSISNGVASGQMNGILPNMHPNMAAANMAVAAAGFWPMMTGLNGIHGPPPLIPVNPLHPLNIQVPSSEQKLVANNVVNGVRTSPNEDSNPHERAPVESKEDARPSAPESGMSIQETQMNAQFQHMMKMHENHQDLFRMFGIRPESVMEEQLNAWKILAERERELMMKLARDESNVKPDQKEVSRTTSPVQPGTIPQEGETLVKVNPKVAENAGNQAWIMDAVTANQQTSLSPHPNKEHYNKVVAADLAAQIEAEAQTNGECPLDLTKASSNEDDSGIVHSTDGVLDYSPNVMQRKRPLDSDGSKGSQPGSRSASPTPKKRKRKGKAYKLDTLCMKLQERYTDSPPAGEDVNQDYYSDYMPERDMKSGHFSETAKSDRDSENSENSDDGFDRTKEFQHSLSSGRLSPNENELTSQSEAHEKSSNQENEDPDKKQEVNGEKPNDDFSCPHCDIMFKNCVMYNLHMGYHGYHDPFKCNKCGHVSKDSVEFYLHIGQVAH